MDKATDKVLQKTQFARPNPQLPQDDSNKFVQRNKRHPYHLEVPRSRQCDYYAGIHINRERRGDQYYGKLSHKKKTVN